MHKYHLLFSRFLGLFPDLRSKCSEQQTVTYDVTNSLVKGISFFCCLLYLSVSPIFSQTTETIILTYDITLDDTAGPGEFVPPDLAGSEDATATNLSLYPLSTSTSACCGLFSSGWSETIDLNKYYHFSFSAVASSALDQINSLSMTMTGDDLSFNAPNQGPEKFEIRASTDNFSTYVTLGTLSLTSHTYPRSFSSDPGKNITITDFSALGDLSSVETVEFRIYPYDIGGGFGSARVAGFPDDHDVVLSFDAIVQPDEIAPTFTSAATANYVENGAGVAYMAGADETVTFTLGNTKDESLFSLANDNEISFSASPDFENPADGNTDNAYLIDVIATDGAGNATTLEVTITVTDADEIAPTFTSSATIDYEENGSGVAYTAVANESVTFTLGNAKDEALFSLANANEISFSASPDYETPADDNTDNGYVLDVIATDGSGNATTLEVTITVTNVFEGSSWLGTISSNWTDASNWNGGIPSSISDVMIAVTSFDPIISGTVSVNDLEIQTGATLTVNSGAALAIMGTVTGDGEAIIKRKTNADLGYSIIGSPITDATIAGLGADVIYDFDGTDWNVPTGTMTPGKGYFAAFNDAVPEVVFTGTPNTGTINKSVALGGDNFNIVANPYAAAISRADFIAANGSGVIDGNVWLWDDGGSNVGGDRGGDYIAVNNVGTTSTVDLGDGVSGSETSAAFNGNIGSVQGFLVLATANANISFTPSMQVTTAGGNDDANHFRTGDIQKLRLSLEGDGLYSDILIALAEGATEGKDYGLDAEKYSGNDLMSFYSTQKDKRYAIQTLPHVISDSREVKLGMELGESAIYTLEAQDMENMEGLTLILNDNLTGEQTIMTKGSTIIFTASAGSISDRFSLTFINDVLGEESWSNTSLKVYKQVRNLMIQYPSRNIEEIGIYTLSGQLVHKENVQFRSGEGMMDAQQLSIDQLYILRVNNQSVKFILK